jgi:hypothetical protein
MSPARAGSFIGASSPLVNTLATFPGFTQPLELLNGIIAAATQQTTIARRRPNAQRI